VKFAAAIFDMDGLLIDSEPLWHRAEITVFATVGVHLTADQCRETTGLRIDEVVRYRYRQQPWQGKSLEQIEREVLTEVQRLAVTEGEALPGVHDVLALFAAEGLPLAIASASPAHMIRAIIAHLGIASYFNVLCSAADEEHGKPHPAVYLQAARQLGVAPQRCIAFEDSIPGVQSAHAAGMTVVAVPDAHFYGRPEYGIAALQLRSLTEFDLAALDPSP
jgi:mannitol-1-/sugar-/sorbitol-6-/2-deoxyglucose-6-phosphatase